MKKLLLSLMAIIMTVTAMAQSIAPQKMMRAKTSGQKSELFSGELQKNFRMRSELNDKLGVAKAAQAGPQKAGQTFNLVATSYHAEDYTTASGDWYITMQTEDSKIFTFDIYAQTLEPGKTYTFSDMDPYYTGTSSVDATDAEFTLTIDENDLIHVVAMMVAGGDTYNITYDEKPAVEHTWGEWEDFKPLGEATGDYTHNVMLSTKITNLPVQVRYATDEPTLAQVKVSNWAKGMLSTNGVDFIFEWNTVTNKCVVPENETGYNYQTYGQVRVADVSVWQGMDYYSNFPCTYNPATGTFSLCVAYYIPGAGNFGYSGDTKGHTPETLVMNVPAKELTGDTIRHEITKNASWVDKAESQGWFQLYQNDATYNASISTANSPLNQGDFSNDDLDADFTFIAIDGNKLTPANLQAKIEIDEETKVVKGILWVTDKTSGDVYEVTMTHDPSKPVGMDYDEDTEVEMNFEFEDINQNSVSGNSKKTINFRAANNNNETIALTLYASSTDADIVIPEGEYTFATNKAAGTALISTGVSSSGSVSRSYLATVDEEGYLDKLWFITGGKVTVTKVQVGEKYYPLVEVDGINSWGVPVKATVGSLPEPLVSEAALVSGGEEITLNEHAEVAVEQAEAVVAKVSMAVREATYLVRLMEMQVGEESSTWEPTDTITMGDMSINGTAYAEFDMPITFETGNKYQITIAAKDANEFTDTVTYVINGAYTEPLVSEAALVSGGEEITLNEHAEVAVEQAEAVVAKVSMAVREATYLVRLMEMQVGEESSTWEPTDTIAMGEMSINGTAYAEFDMPITFETGNKYQITIAAKDANEFTDTVTYVINGAYSEPVISEVIIVDAEENEIALNTHSAVSVESQTAIKVYFGVPVKAAEYNISPIVGHDEETGDPILGVPSWGELSINTIGYAEHNYTYNVGYQYMITITATLMDDSEVTEQYIVNGTFEQQALEASIEVDGTELDVIFAVGTDLGDNYAVKPYILDSEEQKIEVAEYVIDNTTGGFFDPLNKIVIILNETLADGEYTVVLPAGMFIVNGGDNNSEWKYTFTVGNGDPTAINSVAAGKTTDGKFLQNGKVVIVKNGNKYEVSGLRK